jgi:hypothetical protein
VIQSWRVFDVGVVADATYGFFGGFTVSDTYLSSESGRFARRKKA